MSTYLLGLNILFKMTFLLYLRKSNLEVKATMDKICHIPCLRSLRSLKEQCKFEKVVFNGEEDYHSDDEDDDLFYQQIAEAHSKLSRNTGDCSLLFLSKR